MKWEMLGENGRYRSGYVGRLTMLDDTGVLSTLAVGMDGEIVDARGDLSKKDLGDYHAALAAAALLRSAS
jgi:hypothetical protein